MVLSRHVLGDKFNSAERGINMDKNIVKCYNNQVENKNENIFKEMKVWELITN